LRVSLSAIVETAGLVDVVEATFSMVAPSRGSLHGPEPLRAHQFETRRAIHEVIKKFYSGLKTPLSDSSEKKPTALA